MRWLKVENDVVVMVSFEPRDGWQQHDGEVYPGYVVDGSGFAAPVVASKLQPVPAWAFKSVIAQNGLEATVAGIIAAIPDTQQRDRASAKYQWGQRFDAENADFDGLREAFDSIEGSGEFERLWAEAVALAEV